MFRFAKIIQSWKHFGTSQESSDINYVANQKLHPDFFTAGPDRYHNRKVTTLIV